MKIRLEDDEYIIIGFKGNKMPLVLNKENTETIQLIKKGMNNFTL